MSRRLLVGSIPDLYDALQITPTATATEIRTAYRQAALRSHPDKGGTVESFHLVSFAFEVLANAATRKSYDKKKEGQGRWPLSGVLAGNPCKMQQMHSEKDKKTAETTSCPSSCPPRKNESWKVDRDLISDAFTRLYEALKMISVDKRRSVLSSLDLHVRERFLSFVESSVKQSQALSLRANTAKPDVSVHSDVNSSFSEREGCSDEEVFAIADSLTHFTSTDSSSMSSRGRRIQKGVVQVSDGVGRPTSYFASLMFDHLHLSTKCYASVETAIDLHILLVQMRGRAMPSGKRGNSTQCIRSACFEVLTENGKHAEDVGLKASVRFEFFIHTERRKIIVQSPVFSIEEALCWREKLMLSRAQGWKVFREVWIELLQHPGYKHKRPLTVSQACDFVEARASLVQRSLQRMLERSDRKQARAELNEEQRINLRLHRALRFLQRALEEEAAAFRRKKREQYQACKRLRSARNSWLERIPARDMTMSDLMTQMPDDLKKQR